MKGPAVALVLTENGIAKSFNCHVEGHDGHARRLAKLSKRVVKHPVDGRGVDAEGVMGGNLLLHIHEHIRTGEKDVAVDRLRLAAEERQSAPSCHIGYVMNVQQRSIVDGDIDRPRLEISPRMVD